MEPLHDLERGRLVISGETAGLGSKLEPNHQAEPAHFFQHAGKFPDQALELVDDETPDLPRVLRQLIALDNFNDFEGDSAAERVAPECRGVSPSGKAIREFLADPERADR